MPAVHHYSSYNVSQGPSGLPGNALHVGHDVDGSQIYLGRAQYQNELLPAKVIPSRSAAFISYGGQEIAVHNVEILCMGQHVWRAGRGGEIPMGAFHVGTAGNGEWLFVGRAHYQGSLTPGKVHPTHNCMYIPFGGREVSVNEYEVLCEQ